MPKRSSLNSAFISPPLVRADGTPLTCSWPPSCQVLLLVYTSATLRPNLVSGTPSSHSCSLSSESCPLLRRLSFSVSREVWEQVEQQPVGGIQLDAKTVNPPYLHHSTPYTSLSRSGTDFQSPDRTVGFRKPPVDNYVSNSTLDTTSGCSSSHA